MSDAEVEARKVPWWVALGGLLFPPIGLFTFRRGHSRLSRLVSLLWLSLWVLFLAIPKDIEQRDSEPVATSPAPPPRSAREAPTPPAPEPESRYLIELNGPAVQSPWFFSVSGSTRHRSLGPDSDSFDASEGAELVVVTINVENRASRAMALGASQFELTDGNRTWTFSDCTAYVEEPIIDELMQPGITSEGRVCFEVPSGLTELGLQVVTPLGRSVELAIE